MSTNIRLQPLENSEDRHRGATLPHLQRSIAAVRALGTSRCSTRGCAATPIVVYRERPWCAPCAQREAGRRG
jgi:hypothetical protein